MRVQDDHAHAYTVYDLVGVKHYWYLLVSVIECWVKKHKSLTVHLPYEVVHESQAIAVNLPRAYRFIAFGEWLKKTFAIPIYWENAPWLNIGTWDLKYECGETWMYRVPTGVEICLDTGHAMLGLDKECNIEKVLTKYLETLNVRHLHIHENDGIHDQHIDPRTQPKTARVLTAEFIKKITKERTYIYEQ